MHGHGIAVLEADEQPFLNDAYCTRRELLLQRHKLGAAIQVLRWCRAA